jgi:hypothetical protein
VDRKSQKDRLTVVVMLTNDDYSECFAETNTNEREARTTRGSQLRTTASFPPPVPKNPHWTRMLPQTKKKGAEKGKQRALRNISLV